MNRFAGTGSFITSPQWGEVGLKSRVREVERSQYRKVWLPLTPTLSPQGRGSRPMLVVNTPASLERSL